MKRVIGPIIYVIGFFVTYGQINFTMEHTVTIDQDSSFMCTSSRHTTNKIRAFTWGIFPPVWIAAPFLAGYAGGHGWSLGANPDCAVWEAGKRGAK